MASDLSALNKQAIKIAHAYMGGMAWPTVFLTLAVVTAYIAHLCLFAMGLLPIWLACLCMAVLTYFAYTPLHEAVHGNINGAGSHYRWLNNLCGYLVAQIVAVPYTSHKVEHFTHHRFTNIPDKDPDYIISGLGKGLPSIVMTVFKYIWTQSSYFAQHQWQRSSLKQRSIYCVELTLILAWRIAFIVSVAQPGTLLVIIGGYFVGGYFTAYWFAYRPHIPYQNPNRYQNTNSMIVPTWLKPVEWFWLGQNLHAIHHLFPRVPFYLYHKVHKEVEPILHAHDTPIIGIFSRDPVAAPLQKTTKPIVTKD